MKKTIFSLLVALMATTAMAGIPEDILAKRKSGDQVTNSFTESKVMPRMKKETTKKGTFSFTAPEKLRMDYTDPAGDYTLIDKDLFEVSRNGRVQKFPIKNADSRMAVLRNTLLMALNGDVEGVAKLNEATATYKEQGGKYVCTLTSEKGKHGISELELTYDKKTGRIEQLKLVEKNGNYTIYKL